MGMSRFLPCKRENAMTTVLPRAEHNGEQALLADPFLRLHTIFTSFPFGSPTFLHLLVRREETLGPATLTNASLLVLWTLLRPQVPDVSSLFLWHEPTLTAAEKQAVLPSHVAVQKTLTVQVRDRQVLVTGIGDFHLHRDTHLRTLALRLGLPPSAAARCTINPQQIEPQQSYGMVEGMISPFFPWHRSTRLSAIACVPTVADEYTSIAISLSRFESLVVPQTLFPGLLARYARITYPHLPLLDLERKDSAHVSHE
jgi:hypothetical protein